MIAILDRILKLLPPFQRPTMLKLLRELSAAPGFGPESLRAACDDLLQRPPNYSHDDDARLWRSDVESAAYNHEVYLDVTEIRPE